MQSESSDITCAASFPIISFSSIFIVITFGGRKVGQIPTKKKGKVLQKKQTFADIFRLNISFMMIITGAREDNSMKCSYLSGNYFLTCGVEDKEYMPSSFEIQEYCKSDRHKICPLYFKVSPRAQRGRQRPGHESGHCSRH